MLALYNDGNFFAPHEIPSEVQLAIADLVAKSGVDELVVQSLPQFITRAQVEPFVQRLGSVRLEVGIGLQSAHPFVRQVCVNTNFSNSQFESAVAVLRLMGASVKTYKIVAYLHRLGLTSATLCPTRVAKNTLAHRLFLRQLSQPPNLWSIVEVLRRTAFDMQLRVACINLRGSDFESIFPDSCPECADAIVAGLEPLADVAN